MADYLARTIDDRIEKRSRNGGKDRGDISGLRHMGERLVVECKNLGGRMNIGPWLTDAELERLNDDAVAALVVAKKRGTTNPADQIVLLTLADLMALLTGEQPEAGRDG